MATQTTNDKIYQAVDQVRKDANANNDKIYTKIDHLEQKIESNYVTTQEFTPIKNFVYGLIGLLLVAIGTAIISLVLKK